MGSFGPTPFITISFIENDYIAAMSCPTLSSDKWTTHKHTAHLALVCTLLL